MLKTGAHLLFIINPGSGPDDVNWNDLIRAYFGKLDYKITLFDFPDPCQPGMILKKIKSENPDVVVAVGGDGTVKIVATDLKDMSIPMGIIPGGSANGMAHEFDIPESFEEAMENVLRGHTRKIHLTKINDEYCIHLSDIGFNAFVVKTFESGKKRGMSGYIKAALKVIWKNQKMVVELNTDDETITREAAMVVIANASQYGNGVVINPEGSLYDDRFEVVVIRKISVSEIFKMRFTQRNYNPKKTESFQTKSLVINSHRHVHFQVDGEYLGKVNEIRAEIVPPCIHVIVPPQTK